MIPGTTHGSGRRCDRTGGDGLSGAKYDGPALWDFSTRPMDAGAASKSQADRGCPFRGSDDIVNVCQILATVKPNSSHHGPVFWHPPCVANRRLSHMERRFLKGLPSSQTKQIGRSGDSVEIDSSIRNRITIKEPKREGQLGKSRLEFSDPRCISRTPRPRMSCPEVV